MTFLEIVFNIPRRIKTLKRWPKGLGFERANKMNESRLEDIAAAAILDEMKTSVGSFVGYRELTRRLGVRHNIKEPKHKAFMSARKSDSRVETAYA